jgi:hypothetical protein
VSAVFRPILAVLALAAGLATACGATDAGDVAPTAYARSVCSGLIGWRDGVAADSAELSHSLERAADVATVRARYTTFFTATVRRTDQLLAAVKSAGAPKADHGLGYSRDLTAALQQARTGLAGAQMTFAALPTGDLAAYAAGARKVRDSLGTVFARVGTTLDQLGGTYTDSGLNRAFRDDPACQRLSGG